MTKKITAREAFAIKLGSEPKLYERIAMRFMFKEVHLNYSEADISSSVPYFTLTLKKTALFYWLSGYPLCLGHRFNSLVPGGSYERAKKIWETS